MKCFSLALALLVLTAQFAGSADAPAPAEPRHAEIRFGKAVNREAAMKPFQEIIFPKVDFLDSTLREIMEFLNARAKALDPHYQPPGSPLTLDSAPPRRNPKAYERMVFHPGANPANLRLTFALNNVSLLEVIKYIANLRECDLEFRGKPVVLHVMPWVKGPLQARARNIIIPEVALRDATIPEAVEYLQKAAERQDAAGHGVNILYQESPPPKLPPVPVDEGPKSNELPAPAVPPSIPGLVTEVPRIGGVPSNDEPPIGAKVETRITLMLHQVPLDEALAYVAELTSNALRWDANAVVMIRAGKDGTAPVRREIAIDPPEQREMIAKKLAAIVLPQAELKDATIREAIEFIGQRVQALDPDGAGLNMVLKLDSDGPTSKPPRLNFVLKDVSLKDLLSYVAELADLKMSVSKGTIYLVSKKQK